MTHILIIYEATEPGNIETCRVFKMLENKGLLESRGVFALQVSKEDLAWSDVLVFVRSTSSIERDLARLAKRMGKYVILSLDDDFLSLGASYGSDGAGYRQERHKCLKGMLMTIDCLLTVNELLAQKYIKLCNTEKYVVTNTIVESTEMFPSSQDGYGRDKVKLAIYVNDGTKELFDLIIRPALRVLSGTYKGRIALYLMALHPDMTEFESLFDIHFVPHMAYKEFKNYLGSSGFDIGLAPLTDTGFSKYKYFNKYIEYTLAGIPAIYSDCPLYRLVINDHYNGLLTDNSAESWSKAVGLMIDNPDMRKEIIDNAQKHLYDNFESDKVLKHLVDNMPELINYKTTTHLSCYVSIKLLIIKVRYFCFRVRGWLETAFALMRKGEFNAFADRFKKRLRKVKI